jgi:hypothetical protein
MATTITGIVTDITTRTVNTKYGAKPAYTLFVNGDKIDAGFKAPTCKGGDTVTLSFEDGKYGKQLVGTVTVNAAGPGSAPVSGGATPATVLGASGFPVPPLHHTRPILRQNAVARAIDTVNHVGLEEEMTMDNFVAEVIRVARKYEEYYSGDLDLAAAKTSLS